MNFKLNDSGKCYFSPEEVLRDFAVANNCVTFDVSLEDFLKLTKNCPTDCISRSVELMPEGKVKQITLSCLIQGILISCKVA